MSQIYAQDVYFALFIYCILIVYAAAACWTNKRYLYFYFGLCKYVSAREICPIKKEQFHEKQILYDSRM